MTNLAPDDFRKDWYGYLTNQCGHILLGMFLYVMLMWFSVYVSGEFAYRSHVFAVILVGYLIWESVVSTWNGLDSVEDTVFTAVYGAGIPAILFVESVEDGVRFDADIRSVAFMSVFVGVHLAVGVLFRVLNKYGS